MDTGPVVAPDANVHHPWEQAYLVLHDVHPVVNHAAHSPFHPFASKPEAHHHAHPAKKNPLPTEKEKTRMAASMSMRMPLTAWVVSVMPVSPCSYPVSMESIPQPWYAAKKKYSM